MSENVTRELAIEILAAAIKKQGFVPLQVRREDGAVIQPIGTPVKKQQVGTVTFFPQLLQKSADQAEKELKAAVLEACSALVKESAARVDAHG